MNEPIISVSGLRGVIGEVLNPPLAMRFVCAFAAGLPAGPIVLTGDGRASGGMLADAARSALCAVGRNVIDAGVAATPTTGVLVRRYEAAGGIQISASHNPAEYNGIKLFSAAGRVLTADVGQQVVRQYRAGETVCAWVGHAQIGAAQPCPDALGDHLSLVLAIVGAERIRRRRYKALLDSNHGAGSLLGRRLLEELGCKLTLLGGQPDGRFAHPPEPTAENLAGVCRQVAASDVDVGFCQDPDADRLAVIDENGRYLGEEYTLAMSLDHVLRRRQGPVVTNCATSRMSADVARKHGAECFLAAVGEAHVADAMLARGAVFGGEGNGGPIDPRVGYVRDSFVGMALILDAMAERQLKVSELADELPRYAIHKTKIILEPAKAPQALAALEQYYSGAQANRMDGLRLDWPDKWLLVRASNTEPIIRAIAEAETQQEAARLCEEAARVLSSV